MILFVLNMVFCLINFCIFFRFYGPKLLVSKHLKMYALMTCFVLKLQFKQWWNEDHELLDDGIISIHHVINGKLIKIPIKLNTSASEINKITTHDDLDLTEDVLPYLRAVPIHFQPSLFDEDTLYVEKFSKEKTLLQNRSLNQEIILD